MLLSQRPLTAATPDLALATNSARAVAIRVSRNVERGRNTLLLGPRGSGRTSTLSLVQRVLLDGAHIVARLDAAPVDGSDELVAAVRAALGDDARGPRLVVEPGETWEHVVQRTLGGGRSFAPKGPTRREEPRAFNETDVLALVASARRAASDAGSVVVLVDNLEPRLASEVFGSYRDTLWTAPIVWVATGDADRNGYLDPPADVFWEAVEWLEPLERGDVADLVARRLEAARDGDPDVTAIGRVGGRLADDLRGSTPREVVRRLAEIAENGDRGGGTTSERIGAAHGAGGRRAAMLLVELEGIGRPVHAGDEELLARMGLTRPRLVQLLAKLEAAGLVTRHQAGRRVVFEPAS